MAEQDAPMCQTEAEAYEASRENAPATYEYLCKVAEMYEIPLRTKEDFRWFVLFNLLFSIDKKLNAMPDDVFYREMQRNIRTAAEMFLK